MELPENQQDSFWTEHVGRLTPLPQQASTLELRSQWLAKVIVPRQIPNDCGE